MTKFKYLKQPKNERNNQEKYKKDLAKTQEISTTNQRKAIKKPYFKRLNNPQTKRIDSKMRSAQKPQKAFYSKNITNRSGQDYTTIEFRQKTMDQT